MANRQQEDLSERTVRNVLAQTLTLADELKESVVDLVELVESHYPGVADAGSRRSG